jgi:hypothetical protein
MKAQDRTQLMAEWLLNRVAGGIRVSHWSAISWRNIIEGVRRCGSGRKYLPRW